MRQVNIAQTAKETIAIPPGSQPIIESARLNRRLGALLCARIYPVNVKSGMARRVGAEAILFSSTMTTVGSIPDLKNWRIAESPIVANSGTLSRKSIIMKTVMPIAIYFVSPLSRSFRKNVRLSRRKPIGIIISAIHAGKRPPMYAPDSISIMMNFIER